MTENAADRHAGVNNSFTLSSIESLGGRVPSTMPRLLRRRKKVPPSGSSSGSAASTTKMKKHPVKKMIPKVKRLVQITVHCRELSFASDVGTAGGTPSLLSSPTVEWLALSSGGVRQAFLEKDPPIIARDPKPIAGLMEFQQKGLRGNVWKVPFDENNSTSHHCRPQISGTLSGLWEGQRVMVQPRVCHQRVC